MTNGIYNDPYSTWWVPHLFKKSKRIIQNMDGNYRVITVGIMQFIYWELKPKETFSVLVQSVER